MIRRVTDFGRFDRNLISNYCGPLSGLLILTVFGCSQSSSTPSKSQEKTTKAERSAEADLVPDGTPAEILAFVTELNSHKPKFSSQEQRVIHAQKVEVTKLVAADKILAQDADDEILTDAVDLKLMTLINASLQEQRGGKGGNHVIKSMSRAVDQLIHDKRAVVSHTAKSYEIAARALKIPSLSPAEREQLVADAKQAIQEKDLSRATVRNTDLVTEQYVFVNDYASAAAVSAELAKVLSLSPDNDLKMWSTFFQGKANRISLQLPDGRLNLEGNLLDGTPFDWNSYQGKVVLVDFWATWCGPCVGELPNVEAMYRQYHSQGFEVVGISLDRDRKNLESFLERHPLPWPNLYTDPDPSSRGSHPMALKYNVTSIPAAFLVDRDGKIVSMEARGPELLQQLQTLFK